MLQLVSAASGCLQIVSSLPAVTMPDRTCRAAVHCEVRSVYCLVVMKLSDQTVCELYAHSTCTHSSNVYVMPVVDA